tara:strand:- start:11000 stop:11620 length:621 start_codon:yes stop_codon:yes gene_type:complete
MGKRLCFLGGDLVGTLGVIYISDSEPKGKSRMCAFKCPLCGNIFISGLANVRHDKVKSCGCSHVSAGTKHGLSAHPLYNIWNNIKHRTSNKNYILYSSYGLKGVSMHKQWFDSVEVFYSWCISNGWKHGLDIDRVNTKGNYQPDNCRFVTREVNCSNRLNSIIWTFNNKEYKALSDMVQVCGVSSMTIRKRAISEDWSSYGFRYVY